MRRVRAALALLVPAREREPVLRELDSLAESRRRRGLPAGGRWRTVQLLSFGLRLRAESVRDLAGRVGRGASEAGVDVARTARRLGRRPGYLVAAAATLGVGAGGVTTVYAVADWVRLRPVPGVVRPGELVLLRHESRDATEGGFSLPISHPDLVFLAGHVPSVAALSAVTPAWAHLARPGGPGPVRVAAELVTANHLEVLGVTPAAGRLFAPSDHGGGVGPPEAIVAAEVAEQLYGSVREAVGAPLRVNGHAYTVVGVAPPGFRGEEIPGEARAWFPHTAADDLLPGGPTPWLASPGAQLWRRLVARPAPGADAARVEIEARAAVEALRDTRRGQPSSFDALPFHFRAYSGAGLSPRVRVGVDRTLRLLGAASLLLLVLAWANAANLALARRTDREGERAVKRALGAGTGRLARESLAEAAGVGVAAAAVGAATSRAALAAFADLRLSSLGATLAGAGLNARILALCAGVALLAAMASAWIPGRGLAGRTGRGLVPGGRSGRDTPGRVRFRGAMVVFQVSLSLVLVVAAGLMVRTVANLRAVETGMESARALGFALDPELEGFDRARTGRLLTRLRDRLLREPEVAAAGGVWPAPLAGSYVTAAAWGPETPPGGRPLVAAGYDVTPGALDALGLTLLAGRDFEVPAAAAPTPTSEGVLLGAAAARILFPSLPTEAVPGRTVRLSRDGAPVPVRGVVADARLADVREPAGPLLLRPMDGSRGREVRVYVRYRGRPGSLLDRLPGVVREVEPGLPVYALETLDAQVDRLLSEPRVLARLGTVLGGVGLLLTAMGLYGVLAWAVASRTGEIGVRRALGADPAALVRWVAGRGVALVALGLAVGAPAAWAAGRWVESRLVDVAPWDGPTFLVAASAFMAVALLASALPAVRAVAVSPVEALRRE